MTVTGKTLAENLAERGASEARPGDHPARSSDPSSRAATSGSCTATSRPQGSVAKITGKEGERFSGVAKVFDSEEAMLAGLENKQINKGDVVVIRYEGPKGGPGMPEMLTPTSAIMGAGLGADVALAHRWPLLRRVARVHHRPHHAGGTGGWSDRARARRRPHHDRRGRLPVERRRGR